MPMSNLNSLSSHLEELSGKRILVRVNFDVPIEDGQVLDTTRIEDCLPTINALLDRDCKVVLLAHYDRPEGFDPQKSLKPVALVLQDLLSHPVSFVQHCPDPNNLDLEERADLVLVENLRFWPGEEGNSSEFVTALAKLGDIYVNEAFANCHRDHASITGLPRKLPSYAGLRLTEEINALNKIRSNPEQPLVVVIGGAKVETKMPLIEAFKDKADKILVGGKSALEITEQQITLPPNVLVATNGESTKDISLESAKQFADIIMAAQTVVWNGTMGVFEEDAYQQGTKIVAEAINQTQAFTLVGGGDTETALTMFDLESGIDVISTGGGAMLTFLAEGDLVGLKLLRKEGK